MKKLSLTRLIRTPLIRFNCLNKGMRMTDQLDEVLVHGRYAAMLKKIESYFEGNVPHFVAIGSLHLVGPRGLVEILKARGYEVKQL